MTLVHKLINSVINRLPFEPSGERHLIETCLRRLPQAAYWRLKEQGFVPGAIIDIGAHEGSWTSTIRAIFRTSPILMIEAREEQEFTLQRVCTELFNVKYAIVLLGQEQQPQVPFHASDSGSSIFVERSDAPGRQRILAMNTLDDVCSGFDFLVAPFFLKLDVQGAELECLRGGAGTLLNAEVVQLEVALLNYNDGAPQVAEVIAFMDAHGFAMFDIAGFVRPNDVNLVQIDIIFVRKNSSLRPNFFRFKKG